MPLLIAYIGICLLAVEGLQYSQVYAAHAGSTSNFLCVMIQHSGISELLSQWKCTLSGAIYMLIGSFTTNSMVWLVHYSFVVPSGWDGLLSMYMYLHGLTSTRQYPRALPEDRMVFCPCYGWRVCGAFYACILLCVHPFMHASLAKCVITYSSEVYTQHASIHTFSIIKLGLPFLLCSL